MLVCLPLCFQFWIHSPESACPSKRRMIESKCDRCSLCPSVGHTFWEGNDTALRVRPKFNALSLSLHFLCPLSIIRRSAAFFCNDSSLDTARCPNALLARRSRTTRTDRRDDGPAFLQDGRARNGTRPRELSFLIPPNGALVTILSCRFLFEKFFVLSL